MHDILIFIAGMVTPFAVLAALVALGPGRKDGSDLDLPI